METSVAEEKQFNPRLSKDIDTFVNIMENLNLAYPKMIGEWGSEMKLGMRWQVLTLCLAKLAPVLL